MSAIVEALKEFVAYSATLKGDEKGEAQVFCDRLFKAFGHQGYKEAGAVLEERIKKKGKRTTFADLVWKPRLLIEMKKQGEKLNLHYQQAFDYWINAVPQRPRYMVLCNFDEFWIYDFDKQIDEPVDIVLTVKLPERYTALNFLFPDDPPPVFGNDREEVTREAADKVASLFKALAARGSDASAQRFVLQLVVAMFAEDIDLLPSNIVQGIAHDSAKGASSYDLFGGLFRQMASKVPATGGRYKDVRYFNGGLFSVVEPIELTMDELDLIGGDDGACTKYWAKVNPAIFGTIFEQSMRAKERHAYGAHFTSEADILRIVEPTIVRPWRDRIDAASTIKDLVAIRNDLFRFKVLDPACGSGNFLYLTYRELVRLEIRLLEKIKANFSKKQFQKHVKTAALISPQQMYGIDRNAFGVELAKVTLMLAKKLALDEAIENLEKDQIDLPLNADEALPLDNLDANFTADDALFTDWPKVDAVVGNPPYQSKNKIQKELGRIYTNALRKAYPNVDGRSDYCVYWFRKAHDHLSEGQRAGLVGTNTIRQNYSRISGLDYIVRNGGTITDAVSTMVWSGEAVVHVSIVNWVKDKYVLPKRLVRQLGDQRTSDWEIKLSEQINSALSFNTDTTMAIPLKANAVTGGCFQGQTHGHEAFLLSRPQAIEAVQGDSVAADVLFPFLITDDLIGKSDSLPERYVIDFGDADMLTASAHKLLFDRVRRFVLPDRKEAAEDEKKENEKLRQVDPKAKINWHHRNFLARWWLLSYRRAEMIRTIDALSRYIVCGRITKRPIFEFVSPSIRPNDSLTVFPYEDDYSFGILQSDLHWEWFSDRCSTMKADPRYTSNTVFDTFPWPQRPTRSAMKAVSDAACEVRRLRNDLKSKHGRTLRELYKSMEDPGKHPLRDAHVDLDQVVRKAYGMGKSKSTLEFLVGLNADLAAAEIEGRSIVGPGLPATVNNKPAFITDDCISMTPLQ